MLRLKVIFSPLLITGDIVKVLSLLGLQIKINTSTLNWKFQFAFLLTLMLDLV